MSYEVHLSEHLDKLFSKLSKKNRKPLEIILNKIEEISENPNHYKPLRGNLKGIRRVHIDSSFVLIFEINEQNKTILVLDYAHHDEIYKK
ncbi:MAG: type II toxin-antitoxin system RelE family toxin [Candidatus Nanoarchaeia archaeon]